MKLVLQRTSQTPECTQGTLELSAALTLQTLELPWVPDPSSPGGAHGHSCVPAGVYELARHDTDKHPKSFALVNVELGVIHEPDPEYAYARTACLIHVANRVRDLEGCIGVGMVTESPCLILDSRLGLTHFQEQVPWIDGHTLEIRDP